MVWWGTGRSSSSAVARPAQPRRPGPPAGWRPGRASGPFCGLSEALPAGEHQRRGRAWVGGTHERDRCASLIGSVKDEPGRGDLRDLNVWVGTPGVHWVSFPLTGPTPGVQSRGPVALLAEPGGHELAGGHDKVALAGAGPGRRLLGRIDLALHCLLRCGECFTGHRLPGFLP